MKVFSLLAFLMFTSLVVANEWFEGGTIHHVTGDGWRHATYENQLATASDFAYAITIDDLPNLEELKASAIQLVVCLNEVTQEDSVSELPVIELAALCADVMDL